MLRLLSLLQTHTYWPGADLAERLSVSDRTLRRDIDRLRDLGYTVDSVRGVAGGYQMRAGNQLPPLLLEDEEAVAIAVGLHGAAHATAGLGEVAVQALTKLVSTMPPRLRRRIDAVTSQTQPAPTRGPALDAATLVLLAQGCRDDETVRFDYTARTGEQTRRHVEPLRLVSLGRGWYLVAHCRERHDWRSFRLDRITAPELTGTRFRPRELPGGDPLAFVSAGLREVPRRHDVAILLDTAPERVRAEVGGWGDVSRDPTTGGALLRMSVDDFGWPLAMLASLDCAFTVHSPPELADAVAAAGRRFTAAAPGRPA